MPRRKPRFLVLISLLAFSGCGYPAQNQQRSQSQPTQTSDPRFVSRQDFERAGKRWPLTVEAGTLGCSEPARWIEVGGLRYGLNGFATEERGYKEIEPIWARDEEMAAQLKAASVPNEPPLRVNIGDLIEEAGRFC